MYSAPSKRRTKKEGSDKLNLVPILDSVFILIFFLLLSAQFIKIFEISSNVPIVSSKEPPKPKKPLLNLTIDIKEKEVVVLTGNPGRTVEKFPIDEEGAFDQEKLHSLMVEIKKKEDQYKY